MGAADITAVVVAAVAMLAAIFVMARHGATLTGDRDIEWEEKFRELEAAHSYLLRSVREMEQRHDAEQARLKSQIEMLTEHIEEMVVERKMSRLQAEETAAEVAALRTALARQQQS